MSYRVLVAVARAGALAAAVTWAWGCSGKKSQDQASAAAPGADIASPAAPSQPGQGLPAPSKPSQASERRSAAVAEVSAAVVKWVEAQNRGDAAGYHAMYEPVHFKGVKRTSDGKVKRYDAKGWQKDRGRMFKAGALEVAADELSVETWLDPGSKLKPGVSIARFIQRWRGGRYADHGVKVLHWWRNKDGTLRIIYEDLLNSEAGWDRTPDASVAALAGEVPEDNEQALARWRALAPTGADYHDKLAAIPGGPVAEKMARALVAAGGYSCERFVTYEQCGEEYSEWADLEPDATFDDPCLRRRLLMWAIDELAAADLDALSDTLVTLAAVDEPDDEIPKLVLEAVAKASEATRVAVIAAADSGLIDSALTGLSDQALIGLYRDKSLDAAVRLLDADPHASVLAEALGDAELRDDTRMALIDELAGVDSKSVREALATVASDAGSCELAMRAAESLAARGDKSHLPRVPGTPDPELYARALCMMVHDSDGSRGYELWQQLLPAAGKGSVKVSSTDEYDNDGHDEDEDDAEEEGITFTRAEAAENPLSDSFGGIAPSCSVSGAGSSCRVDNPGGHITVTFTRADDGRLYISEISSYTWSGCGC